MPDKILIFVPGHNIAKTIKSALLNLADLSQQLAFDVLYVDNDSSDGTPKIVEDFIQEHKIPFITIIKNSNNLGYGGSQKTAFNYAFSNKYDYLVEYDGDLQYPYQEINNLYNKIKSGDYSVVFGSRITKAQDLEQMPKWKVFGNKITSRLNSWAFDLKVSEIHTGFRIYDLNKIKKVNFAKCHNDYRWTLDGVVEILKVNANFTEIPVKALYHRDASSPSHIELFRAVSYMCYSALKYKFGSLFPKNKFR
jgi:glycosyltransferase involved in cell wall biosynthesis